jgi:uncharacterized membrane protein YoaK (UPF0700 family)
MDFSVCSDCGSSLIDFGSVFIALLTVCTFTAGYVVGTAARRHGHSSLVSFVLTSLTIVGAVLIWIQNLSVYMQLPLLGFLVGLFRHEPEPTSLSPDSKART